MFGSNIKLALRDLKYLWVEADFLTPLTKKPVTKGWSCNRQMLTKNISSFSLTTPKISMFKIFRIKGSQAPWQVSKKSFSINLILVNLGS
jgi:hypothetical protein